MATIVFDGMTLVTPGIPNPLPTPKRPARLKVYYMRRGRTGAGLRVVRRLGCHVSHTDFRIPLPRVTGTQLAQMQTKHDNQEIFPIIIEGTTYQVVFAEEDGLEHSLPKWVEYGDDLYRAVAHVHVLSQG